MTYWVSWLIQIVALILGICAIAFQNFSLMLAVFALVALSMFWPRCRQCGLPAFWRKRRQDPDHFIYYLGNWPPFPGKDCSRCGEDLTL